MKSIYTKVIIILLSIFGFFMVGSQLYIALHKTIKTETAYSYSTTQAISFKGVYVRNETPVYSVNTGVISYAHSNGSKVAMNSTIANVYKSERDLEYQQETEALQAQIDTLTDAEQLLGTDSSQLETIANQINEKHALVMDCIDNGDYSGAQQLENDMLNLFCKKEIVKGEVTSYAEKKAQLNIEINNVRAKISAQPEALTIDIAGYFVNYVDGYENELNYETLKTLTIEDINKIIKNPVKDTEANAIGKLIDGYKWRFVGVLDAKKTIGVNETSVVSIRVGASAVPINATVVSVRKIDDECSIYVFECDRLSAEYVESRVAQFKLIINDFEGIRISRTALRFNDKGEQGVYIKKGSQIVFKKVQIIHWDDDFVLSEITGDSGFLSLYDDVVVEGKDLYDGKIID